MPLPRLKPPYAMICDWCEQVYWACRLTSKYCGGACRQNAFRSRNRQSRILELGQAGRFSELQEALTKA